MNDPSVLQVMSNGRRLEVVTAGPADGLVCVLHGGTPGAALTFGPTQEAVVAAELRYVTYSRPGYAGSDPQPGRRVADAAADVAAILDHLGADRFVTLGWSGGGPHAIACAALLPDRCRAAATMAGVAPWDADGLDWLNGQGAENQAEVGSGPPGCGRAHRLVGTVRRAARHVDRRRRGRLPWRPRDRRRPPVTHR